jgi:membrane protease YdiL (CAAX protease family)
VLLEVRAWGYLAALALMVVAGWFFLGRGRRALFPPPRRRSAPWSGFEVLFAFYLTLLFWPALGYQLLNYAPRLTGADGADRARAAATSGVALAVTSAAGGLAPPGEAAAAAATLTAFATASEQLEELQTDLAARKGVWNAALVFPFQVLSILLVLRLVSGTRPYQLGLTLWRGGANAVAGCLGWLLLTPCVFGLYALAYLCYTHAVGHEPEIHPLTRAFHEQVPVWERGLGTFVALVAAPVLEELLYRGVLQAWLARRSWGGTAAMAVAFVVGLVNRVTRGGEGPAVFVAVLLPGFLLAGWWAMKRQGDPQAAWAIYGTALLFAILHFPQWPAPVPLFVLGLGLGYLTYRTRSLVAPIVLHSMFNAVAVLSLVTGQGVSDRAPPNGKEATSAARRPAGVSTSNSVRGSWLLRRTYASATAVPRRGEMTDEVTWPTSLLSLNSLAPGAAGPPGPSFKPTNSRFTWP